MIQEPELPSMSASVVHLRLHEAGNPRAAEHFAEATRQAMELKHVFGAPPRKPGLLERLKFW
jgi:hypothetical protein